MRNKKALIIGILLIGVILLWNLIGYFIKIKYHEWIRSHKKAYCYQTYWGPINPVLFVDNKSNIDSLIQYYQKIEKGIDNPEFNFPSLSLPYDTCVYILGYEKDSLIAEIVCYAGKKGKYIKGFVYSKIVHDCPANDSMVRIRK